MDVSTMFYICRYCVFTLFHVLPLAYSEYGENKRKGGTSSCWVNYWAEFQRRSDQTGMKAWNGYQRMPKNGIRSSYVGLMRLKPLSHECRIGQRMRNECYFYRLFWYLSKMHFMPIWSFYWTLTIRQFALFVCVIFLLCQHQSFVMR